MSILILSIIGCAIGIISSYTLDPSWETLSVTLVPPLIGLLDGILLGQLYRNRIKTLRISLIALTSLMMAIGMFFGTLLGGMLGTILSIPFPDSWWSHIYLIGTFLGMAIASAGIPALILVNLRDELRK